MKISKTDLTQLQVMIQSRVDLAGGKPALDAYREKLANDPRVKDQGMRLRWDLFWMLPNQPRKEWIDRMYANGCNDTHVDTALRAVMASIN